MNARIIPSPSHVKCSLFVMALGTALGGKALVVTHDGGADRKTTTPILQEIGEGSF